jgi:hypothetical protein
VELRISDGERSRYTEIYGKDPLARDGWLTRRMRHELTILGCDISEDFDLLGASEGQTLETPSARGRLVQIAKKRDKDASIFCVLVKW